MKKLLALFSAAVLTASLAGCSGSPKSADLSAVLDRTLNALTKFDSQLKSQNIAKITEEQMPALIKELQQAYNAQPAFYPSPIGVALKKDASFDGFKDDNKNNIKDSGEKTIFTVEIDSQNSRLIATDETGTSTFRGAGTGFLAGALMGHLLGRQMAAGVRPGAFNNRRVSSPSSYQSARSASRSGGSSSRK